MGEDLDGKKACVGEATLANVGEGDLGRKLNPGVLNPFEAGDRDDAASARSAKLVPTSEEAEGGIGSTIASDFPPSIAAAVSSKKSASLVRFSAACALNSFNSLPRSDMSLLYGFVLVENIESVGEFESEFSVNACEPRNIMLPAELFVECTERLLVLGGEEGCRGEVSSGKKGLYVERAAELLSKGTLRAGREGKV